MAKVKLVKIWKPNELQVYTHTGWNYDPEEDTFWYCKNKADYTGFGGYDLTPQVEKELRKQLVAK